MSKGRACFTADVVTILFGILPEHVTPAGGKIDWDVVASTLNTRTGLNYTSLSVKNWFSNMKDKHKAWNELKKWTGIGWTENGCPEVDEQSEKWQGFLKRYKSIAKGFLKNPLENEAEWDKILRSGYAMGDRSYTPASVGKKKKEALTIEAEASGDSDDVEEVETRNNEIERFIVPIETRKRNSVGSGSQPSTKRSREEDIDVCLDQMRRSTVSQSSKPKNPFDEVLNILETMGIVAKYGETFAVDILDSFRGTPGAIDLFTSLRSDKGRLHFLKKHCVLEDDVYRPVMPTDSDNYFDATMGFPHPPSGKYYVVDSAYPNTLGYLSPHVGPGTRYHLPDFKKGTPPEGKFEQFNYRHSSCRNVIERVFAVLKNRWKVLQPKSMPQMDLCYQLQIIVACCTLHNYIRLHDLGIPFTHQIEVMEPREDHSMYDDNRKEAMDGVRHQITDQIWESIQKNPEVMEQVNGEEEDEVLTDYED